MPSLPHSKTVIILGAGFTFDANIPIQNQILKQLSHNYSTSPKWKKVLKFFNENIGTDIEKYLLEDIFTIFDKCIMDEESFGTHDYSQIIEVYDALLYLIRKLYNDSIDSFKNNPGSKVYLEYKKFIDMIVRKRTNYRNNLSVFELDDIKKKIENVDSSKKLISNIQNILETLYKKDEDRLSIVSLNWDYLLEYLIYKHHPADVKNDFVIYDYGLSNKPKIPSIQLKSRGYTNLKILKPHGSSNWAKCPCCDKIFTSYGQQIKKKPTCLSCKNELYPLMVTPTFLKDMTNNHIKQIWQNLFFEINEASNIIFIGYSFRSEDFYFRYLLSKAIKPGTKITVFGFDNKTVKTDYSIKNQKKYDDGVKYSIKKLKRFINKSKIQIHYYNDGWRKHINEIESIL